METKWKLFSVLLIGLLCWAFFFLVKGSRTLNTSKETIERIKKTAIS